MRLFWRRKKAAAAQVTQSEPIDPEIERILAGSGVFDPRWYEWRYPDIHGFPGGPFTHFCNHGLYELRDPSPYVSPTNYLRRYPDAAESDLPPLLHALANPREGEREEAWASEDERSLTYLLETSGLFDEAWYVARYPDLAFARMTPIEHFIRHGAGELRDPGPDFDSRFYNETQPGHLAEAPTPIEAYLRFGRARGHSTKGPSAYVRWINAFDELTPDDIERIRLDTGPAPRMVAILQIADPSVCQNIGGRLAAWTGQIGVSCRVRVIRGAGICDEEWRRCGTSVSAAAVMALDPSEALIGLTDGDVLLLCLPEVLVRPHASYVLTETLCRRDADACYADHDHIDEIGTRSWPVFKPTMSPEFMRQIPYAGALVATVFREDRRTALVSAIAAAVDGGASQAWASYLLALDPGRVARAPFIVSHLRAGARAGMPDDEIETAPTNTAPLFDPPTVTVVIPTRNRGALLRACIDSILAHTCYEVARLRIVVVDNDTDDPETLSYLEELAGHPRVGVIQSPGLFNFSAICNKGAAAADGDILVFLNNDTIVRRPDWLTRLVTYARQPDIGAVGAQLLFPDGTVQHGGVVLGVQGVGAHRLARIELDPACSLNVTREMVSVTGACLAVRREVFEEAGGFDPVLRIAFNDLKLCATIYQRGYRNVYVGEALFFHHESKSRGYDLSIVQKRRNAREAIYVREQLRSLFFDDPSYSPNLSLQSIGELAQPPRVVRPWRRSRSGQRRALLLSRVLGLGHGVATVLEQQALFLLRRGWEVIVGGPSSPKDLIFKDCLRINLWGEDAAASFAVREGVDCVIAHTPPFFSIARYLGPWPLIYFFDHGEPTPHLFPDSAMRDDVNWEKRFNAPLARRVFTISETVHRSQFRSDATVIRNGNSHLDTWSVAHAARRDALREKLGFAGRFVVLNVCRFGAGERQYKGIDTYAEVAGDAPYLQPSLAGQVVFALAGRGDEQDVRFVSERGIIPFANISDQEMTDLYVASDLYMSLSKWEGYNLGIGQALAMGLKVIASDIEAHREFDVERHDSVLELCAALARAHEAWQRGRLKRQPVIHDWDLPLTSMLDLLEQDLEAERARHSWF